MDQISMPGKNLGQMQLCAEGIFAKAEPFQELQQAIKPAQDRYKEFLEAIQRDRDSNVDKKELDNISDGLIRGMNNAVKSEIAFPYEGEQAAEVQKELSEFYAKHGPSIAKLQYNEQPAAVDKMLADFDRLNLNALPGCSLQRWREPIFKANENFKKANMEQASEKAEADALPYASYIAPQLKNDVDNLLDMMYVFARLGQNKEIVKAYREVFAFVDSFR